GDQTAPLPLGEGQGEGATSETSPLPLGEGQGEGALAGATFGEPSPGGRGGPAGKGSSGGSTPAADLSQLQHALARSAERCYPASARRFRLTGEAKVRFCLDDNGTVSALALTRSTGKPLLDDAAERCVVQ